MSPTSALVIPKLAMIASFDRNGIAVVGLAEVFDPDVFRKTDMQRRTVHSR